MLTFETRDKVIKTVKFISRLIIIKNKIFAKHIIDKSNGTDISINSPPKDISCLDIL